MLGEGDGEDVGAIAFFGIGDEVVVVGLCGLCDGGDGGEAWAGDGAGGEAGMEPGVVGRGVFEIDDGEFAFPPAVLADGFGVLGDGELDGGVGAEAVAGGEAVVEDAGDEWAFFGDDGFAFDDGGEGEGLVGVEPAGGGGGAELGGKALVKGANHVGDEVVHGGADGEDVGIGEEVALEAGALGEVLGEARGELGALDGGEEFVARAESGLFGEDGHFFDTKAFGEGDAEDGDGFADGEEVEDGGCAGPRGEEVIAGAEEPLEAGEAAEELELAARADDSEFLEAATDLTGGGAAFDGEGDGGGGGFGGVGGLLGEVASDGGGGAGNQPGGEQGDEDDEREPDGSEGGDC